LLDGGLDLFNGSTNAAKSLIFQRSHRSAKSSGRTT
jgi:hypothetical protein